MRVLGAFEDIIDTSLKSASVHSGCQAKHQSEPSALLVPALSFPLTSTEVRFSHCRNATCIPAETKVNLTSPTLTTLLYTDTIQPPGSPRIAFEMHKQERTINQSFTTAMKRSRNCSSTIPVCLRNSFCEVQKAHVVVNTCHGPKRSGQRWNNSSPSSSTLTAK